MRKKQGVGTGFHRFLGTAEKKLFVDQPLGDDLAALEVNVPIARAGSAEFDGGFLGLQNSLVGSGLLAGKPTADWPCACDVAPVAGREFGPAVEKKQLTRGQGLLWLGLWSTSPRTVTMEL